MRIARIRVSNHRSVPDLDAEVREHLVLVGPNESGKTSLLRLLDGTLRGSLGALYNLIEPAQVRDAAHPLDLELEFSDFTDEDKASLPDQIEALPGGGHRLRLLMRATLSASSGELTIERRFLKPGLTLSATAPQLSCIGWAFLPAARSPDRELGVGRTSAIRGLLEGVDLGASLTDVMTAVTNLHNVVHGAPSLLELRGTLAGALADLLPRSVDADDLVLELPRADDTNPLADIDVKLRDASTSRPLRDQSDGVRAMSTIAIQLLAGGRSTIVAVDEPEVHLHPRAQAKSGAMLRAKADQAIVATHSPAVLTQFSPMHVLAFVGGSCRQLSTAPFADDPKAADHWWTSPTLEPLTSRGVILVEGIADRVLVEAAARLIAVDLDRIGVAVAAVHGAGGFKMALRLFGASGFGVPIAGLVDFNEAADVAKYLGIDRADVESAGFSICSADLEAECVRGLTPAHHADLLVASGLFKERGICAANSVSHLSDLEEASYADWCRKHKTEVATALAGTMTAGDAAALPVMVSVVTTIVAKIA